MAADHEEYGRKIMCSRALLLKRYLIKLVTNSNLASNPGNSYWSDAVPAKWQRSSGIIHYVHCLEDGIGGKKMLTEAASDGEVHYHDCLMIGFGVDKDYTCAATSLQPRRSAVL